jgi:ATP-binding protein involved in chromosome partitioning
VMDDSREDAPAERGERVARPDGGATTAVRRAVADAGIGADHLGADLATLDAIAVESDGGAVTATVTLPVPDERIREALGADLRALDAVDAIEWRPAVAAAGGRVELIPDVKNVVAVSSGKGGVGKSTVAANLAVSLADAGAEVGLLDGDVYGPNAPTLLGLSESTPATTSGDDIVPREAHGVRVMSMDFVVEEDDPVIWRGPIVDDLLTQFFDDVRWGDLDYLVVDLPPGTGDAQLTLVQHLPVAGAVVVTTPQSVAVDDARRGLEQFARYDVPVLGVAENMAGFQCSDCGGTHRIFGDGGGADLAAEFEVPLLGQVPLDPSVGDLEDDPSAPPGVDVPLVGRLQLPRTREERETEGTLPPSALRDDGGETRTAFRSLATHTAARVAQLAALDR